MNAIQTTTQTASNVNSPLASVKEASTEEGEEGFGNELAAAEGVAAAAVLSSKTGLQATPENARSAKPAATDAAMISGKAKMARLQDGTNGALQSGLLNGMVPNGQRVATSLNTASDIAGLKPWNKDWVMQGVDPMDTRPLFGQQGQPRGDAEELATMRMEALQTLMRQAAQQASPAGAEGASALQAGADSQGAPAAQQAALNPMLAAHGPMGTVQRLNGEASQQAGGTEGYLPAATEATETAAAQKPAALSGSDYLQTLAAVRGESGEKGASANLSVAPLDARGVLRAANKRPSAEVKEFPWGGSLNEWARMGAPDQAVRAPVVAAKSLDAQVVSGSMARPRLSTDTVMGVAGELRALGTQGGGAMTLRLKPDHLGELHLRVSTNAHGHVALQIRASDERAKQVLEDSLSSLKESMASQNLKLASVDLGVARASSGQDASGFGMNLGGQQQSSQNQQQLDAGSYGAAWAQQEGMRQYSDGFNGGGNANQSLWDSAENPGESRGRSTVRATGSAAGLSMASSAGQPVPGRLDVRG